MRLQMDKPVHCAEPNTGKNHYGVAPQAGSDSTAQQPRPAHVGYIRLEIRCDRLHLLLADKALAVEDLRGLDRKATQWIRQCLLETLKLGKRR